MISIRASSIHVSVRTFSTKVKSYKSVSLPKRFLQKDDPRS